MVATILALALAFSVTTISWASEVENVAQTTKGNTTTQYSSLAEALNAAKDGGTVELLKNVTLTSNWTTVGTETEPFKGTFDGKGYTITGLTIPTSDNEYMGFIGMLDGGTVKNVKFASVSVNGKDDVGTAVGRIINGGIVSGVQVLGGTVSGAKRVGGVVGSIKASGTVSDCTNAAVVTANDRNAGGIVGSAYYTETGKQMYITNCVNNGAVTASGVCGGIVSLSAANVSGNTNTAAVKGTEVGGIVGEQKSYGSVTNNTNSGAVTNTSDSENAAYGAGGIIGWLRYHGTSEASAYEVSDIISVTGNKNSGSVTGGNDAGGIVGTVYNSAVIMNNKNTATSFSAATFAAGIVGNYQTTETPAATAPALNKLTFGSNNTSTTPLEQITAQCKDLLIYTNGNPIIEEVVPDPAPEQPPHYYYHPATDTKTDTTKGSPKTFDAGIGIYAVTAVLSVTGMAWTAKKRH